MPSILETGKDGYDADREFDERTARALGARGRDDRLFVYDAVEVQSFVEGDYPAVVPVLAPLAGYRALDLGCGYGRLCPFLSAFDCAEYLGVDRVEARLDHARERYGSRLCRFEVADALTYRPGPRYDVVWTSNVLQHLLFEDKLRLVETASLARAPGGVILMREARIIDETLTSLEKLYAAADYERHMIPVPFAELARAFAPLVFRKIGGIVYMASEE